MPSSVEINLFCSLILEPSHIHVKANALTSVRDEIIVAAIKEIHDDDFIFIVGFSQTPADRLQRCNLWFAAGCVYDDVKRWDVDSLSPYVRGDNNF